MFAHAPDASNIAFATFVRQLELWGFAFDDCQMTTYQLARSGAVEWTRDQFLDRLEESLAHETRRGEWFFDAEA